MNFNTGVKTIDVNGVPFRFNPLDTRLYAKAQEIVDWLQNEENNGKNILDIDREANKRINELFGAGNDYDKMLDGCSWLAINDNGDYLFEAFLNELMPHFEKAAQERQKKITDRVQKAVKARNERKVELAETISD